MSIAPAVGVDVLFTDNALVTAKNTESDTVVRTWLEATAKVDSVRTRAALFAAVFHDAYVDHADLSGWSFTGHGDVAIDLLPQTLSIEAQGGVVNGSISTFGSSATDRAGTPGRVAFGTYAVGPRLTLDLGDVADFSGTGQFGQVLYWARDKNTQGILPEDDTLARGFAQIDTGARSRRGQLVTTAEVVHDENGYELANVIQTAFLQVNPVIRVILRGGYEHVEQTGVSGFSIDAPVAVAGVEWRPNGLSKISFEAGTRYDHTNWTADAEVRLGRTNSLYGFYREVVQPDQLFWAQSFATVISANAGTIGPTTGTAAGPPVGVRTGPMVGALPDTLTLYDNLYSTTSLIKSGGVRAAHNGDITTLMLTGEWTDRQFLPDGGQDRTLRLGLAYARRLRPHLTLSVQGDYWRTFESPLFGPSESYECIGGVVYALNSTTQFAAQFIRRDSRQSGAGGQTVIENAVAVAIRKAL